MPAMHSRVSMAYTSSQYSWHRKFGVGHVLSPIPEVSQVRLAMTFGETGAIPANPGRISGVEPAFPADAATNTASAAAYLTCLCMTNPPLEIVAGAYNAFHGSQWIMCVQIVHKIYSAFGMTTAPTPTILRP